MLYTLWFGVGKGWCFSVSTSPSFKTGKLVFIWFWHLDAGDPICTLIYILHPLGSQPHRSLSYCKDFESSLDSGKMKPVNLKGNQRWIFIGRTAAEAEAQILWPPDTKSCLIAKDPDVGKDWRQEKGMTEDETVGWHHQLDEHEFEQTLGDGDEQGSLGGCSPVAKSRAQLSNWIMNNNMNIYICKHIYLYKQFCWTVIPDASITSVLNLILFSFYFAYPMKIEIIFFFFFIYHQKHYKSSISDRTLNLTLSS